MEQHEFVEAYLARLGLERRQQADVAGLRAVQASHLRRVPFENLSVHLGEPITLGFDGLVDKILGRRRGGFCYELNGLFAELLVALGYRVTLLGARVWDGHQFGPPLDHLALRVECVDDAVAWLADVGFGAHSLYPLRLETGLDQADPSGVFRVEPAPEGDLDVLRDGTVQYRIEAHPRVLAEFEAMCWYQQTSPRSHFTRTVVCTIQTGGGRLTLSGNRLIRTEGQKKQEIDIDEDSMILDEYRTSFGIELDQVPRVHRA